MINKLLAIILILIAVKGIAQKLDAVRIEVSSDIDGEQFHVEPLEDDGIIIFYESNEVNKEDKRKWYFGLFDSNLKQRWLKFVPLIDKIEFVSSKNIGGQLYLLFKNISQERTEFGYYEIVKYDKRKESFFKVSGSIPAKADVAGFDIVGNTACLALNLKKRETDLVFINLNSGDVNPIHINKETPGYIESLFADRINNTFYVSIKQNRDRRYIKEYLFSYSINGELLKDMSISNIEPLKYFRDYAFMVSLENELLIFGTYSIITGKNLSFKDIEEEIDEKSVGMYFMSIVNGKQESLKFYDFMRFNNISGAIGPSNISTSKMPQDTSNSARSSSMVSASFNLTEPKVFLTDEDVYIFSTEVYRPYYKTETRMDYDFYGRPYPYTYNIFSGYEFYDAIVAGLSKNGDLIWSNDFPIVDVLTYSIKRNSTVFEDDDLISMAYVNNGSVISQTIEGPADIDRSEMKIGTNSPQDRISQDENNYIMHWYGDYFLIYGYQKLKNRTMGDKSTRTVFYANKIAYK